VLHNELYRRTAEDLLLKCLGTDQVRIAMGEVHEGILWYASIGPEDEVVIA
jgi:hypothetical protein